MSYLSRESASLPDGLWKQIDATVINTARNVLTCRRFYIYMNALGIGTESINIDDASLLEEHFDNGFITTKGRKFVEIPTIYEDFTILARDLENSEKLGYPVDDCLRLPKLLKHALRKKTILYSSVTKLMVMKGF